MTQVETVYSAKQVAAALGISGGMLRRYAMALEAVTGEPIRQHPRDGRQYTAAQLEVLTTAKAFVGSNAGMGVEAALRLALGHAGPDIVHPPASLGNNAKLDAEVLTAALEHAVTPLLTEMRALRSSNERLEVEVAAFRAEATKRQALQAPTIPARSPESPSESPPVSPAVAERLPGGALVRVAERLEQVWERITGRS